MDDILDCVRHVLRGSYGNSFGRVVNITLQDYNGSVAVDWLDNGGYAYKQSISMELINQVAVQLRTSAIYSRYELDKHMAPEMSPWAASLAYDMSKYPKHFVNEPMPESLAKCLNSKPQVKPKKELALCSKHLWE